MLAGKWVSGLPRRSICRNSCSRPTDSGSEVSWLFRRCNSRNRDKRPIESGSDVSWLSDALRSIKFAMPQTSSGKTVKRFALILR